MTSNRNLISTESRELETSGTHFDDGSVIQGLTDVTLSRIVIWHGEYINALTMHYSGGQESVVRGGQNDTRAEVVLESGEYITIIEGVLDSAIMGKLTFVTNKGTRFGPYGRGRVVTTLVPFVWKASNEASADLAPRMGLLYFSGHSSSTHIHRLRATFGLYPVVELVPSDLKYEKQVSTESNGSNIALSSFARNLMSPVITLLVGADNVQFHASEATLCRIAFFRAALQGEFREAAEKKITLPDEEPEVFSALIEHLYNGTYTYTYNPATTTPLDDTTPVSDLSEGCFHVSVYAVAFKYGWQPLVDAAVRNFLCVLSKLVGIDIVRLWNAAYADGLTVGVCSDGGRLAGFQKLLPKVLKELYKSNAGEMEITVTDMPSLANDFMRLLVSDIEE